MMTRCDIPRRLAYPIPEAAALLGVSPRQAYRLISSKRLRTVRIGEDQRVPHQEIERFVTPEEVAA